MTRNPDQDTFSRFEEGRRERGRFGDNESAGRESARKSDLVDLSLLRHAETAKAILVSETGLAADAVWVPKSQCESVNNGDPQRIRGITVQPVTVTMPEWMAREKKLV